MNLTAHRVLDAAERLFARQGVSAVSLRDINTAARVSQGVIHYHFKDRDGLIRALLERHLPGITAERKNMVMHMRQRSYQPTLRELLSVIVVPLARVAIEKGEAGQRFVRVVGQLHAERNPVFQEVSGQLFNQIGLELLHSLSTHALDISPEQVELHLGMSMQVTYSALAEMGQASFGWAQHLNARQLPPWEYVAMLLDFLCYGFSGSGMAMAE